MSAAPLPIVAPRRTSLPVLKATGDGSASLAGADRYRLMRMVLVAGYLGLSALGFVSDRLPLIFWTILLPLLPMSIVLMGFPTWRKICPLAAFGEVGRRFHLGQQRKAPAWLHRRFFVVTFVILLAMLVVRLVATNGDAPSLGGLLLALAGGAFLTNLFYTGKTWCNFVCPVGLVERIYTEPGSLSSGLESSQCTRCTACKKFCPDIDQENGYWREIMSSGRRFATTAFPGLVLAFYVFYWLRAGTWEAYLDGRWTRLPFSMDLIHGPGFFFAPGIPAVVAATLTLVGFSLMSFALFLGVEAVLRGRVVDQERRRHLVLTLASFTAFCVFYLFAGAPSLRKVPGATSLVQFVVPVVATLFTVKRWRRTRDAWVREKGAARLLRRWPFEQPPPEDPAEVWAWVQAGEHAQEQQLVAYAQTVREMVASGLVTSDELRLLDEIRNQLGISDREHEKVLAGLAPEERELFSEDRVVASEVRLQLRGYEKALTEALGRRASEVEVAELRLAFGVGEEAHAEALGRIRADSGGLVERAFAHLDRARQLDRDLGTLQFARQQHGARLLAHLLGLVRSQAIGRVLELLEAAEDGLEIARLRFAMCGPDEAARRAAFDHLPVFESRFGDVVEELRRLVLTSDESADPEWNLAKALDRIVEDRDAYLRAAAVWTARGEDCPTCAGVADRACDDEDPLVREIAGVNQSGSAEEGVAAAPGASRFEQLTTIERMGLLHDVSFFARLEPEDLHEMVCMARIQDVDEEGSICRQGDPGEDLFVILEGRADVLVHRLDDSAGEQVRTATLGPGELLGEMSLLDGSPRSATVRPGQGGARLLRIPGADFRRRLLHRARVSRPLLATLSDRIRLLSQQVACSVVGS